jgi:molybdopterin/thiamine biosynthesis adenylyltransferase
METLSVTRNLEIFNPDKFTHPIHIIGVGATGSKITLELAKLGIDNIHVWDNDIVERKNVCNQEFGLNDVGKDKVDALADIVKLKTGLDLIKHNEFVKDQELEGIIFLLTDSMSSRKEIYDNCLKLNLNIPVFIETRMGVDEGRLYTINPIDLQQLNEYEKSLYSSEEVTERSACGTVPGLGATSGFISSVVVWQFIMWYKRYVLNEENIVLKQRVLFYLNPFQII